MQSSQQDHTRAIRAITESKSHVRSLHLFCGIGQMPTLVGFHALRVLDLRTGWELGNKQIKHIGSLSQLRYLRLDGGGITELPEEIGKLWRLETLDLWGCWSITRLPSTIVQLRKLVRLFVSPNHILPAAEFSSMEALEEVSCVGDCWNPVKLVRELGSLTKLRKVSINCSKIIAFAPTSNHKAVFLKLLGAALLFWGKNNLEDLIICGNIGAYLFSDPGSTFPYLQSLIPDHFFPHLQHLNIIKFVARVPKGMAFLEKVVKLHIRVTEFGEECLHILMGLPSLAHLELFVWGLADVNRKMIVCSHGFKLLKVFRYETNLHEKVIAFAAGAMPALQRLHLCLYAKELMSGYCGGADLGLEHLSALTHLQLETNCSFATLGEVKALEGSVEEGIASHPNRHTLQMDFSRTYVHEMLKDDSERENIRKHPVRRSMEIGITIARLHKR